MNTEKLRLAFNKSDFDGDGYLNEFETNHFGYLLFGHKNHGELYTELCKYCRSNPLFGLNFTNILELFPVTNESLVPKAKKRHKSKKHKKKHSKHKKAKHSKHKNQKQKEKGKEKQKQKKDILDDIDDWGDLPPSDKTESANQDLNHIRQMSAFVMSHLKDSSDSELKKEDEATVLSACDTFKEIVDNTEIIYALRMEVSQWKDKFTELEQNKSNIADRYKKLEKQFVNVQNEYNVSVKQHELSQLNEQERALNHRISSEESTAKAEKLREANHKLNREVALMTENIDSLNEMCEEYRAKIKLYKGKIEKMEADTVGEVSELKQYSHEWKEKYESIRDKYEELVTSESKYARQIAEYERQLSDVVSLSDYKAIESQCLAVQTELSQMKDLLQNQSVSDTENMSKIKVLNTRLRQLQNELSLEKQKSAQTQQSILRKNEIQIRKIKIEYEGRISQSDLKIDQLNQEIYELQKKIKKMTETEKEKVSEVTVEEPFNFDFFATINDNENGNGNGNESNHESNESNESNENNTFNVTEFVVEAEAEDEHENEQINISNMENVSAKQKFLLLKARMAAKENGSDESD